MKKSRKRKYIFVKVFAAILVVLFIIWIIPDHRYNGIDISHYQEKLDWNSIKKDKHIKFCLVKATEGGTYVDEQCINNVKKSNLNGLKTGLYHYFRTGVSGKKQFDNFNKVLKQCKYQIIPAIDVERERNDLDLKGKANKNLEELIECFKKEYGYYPIIYLGSFDALTTLPAIIKCKWWVRCIKFRNLIPSTIKQVEIKKYKGIEVDMDYCSNIEDILIPNT